MLNFAFEKVSLGIGVKQEQTVLDTRDIYRLIFLIFLFVSVLTGRSIALIKKLLQVGTLGRSKSLIKN